MTLAIRIFSWPGRSPGRAIVLTPALASALAKCSSFYAKVFYVMGKALSGELSCPCDRSCWHFKGKEDSMYYNYFFYQIFIPEE